MPPPKKKKNINNAGLVESPEAFAKGVAKGSMSLVRNSVHGLFDAASKVTGSVGKGGATRRAIKSYVLSRNAIQFDPSGSGLAAISMDDDYQRQRRANQQAQPKHVVRSALLEEHCWSFSVPVQR